MSVFVYPSAATGPISRMLDIPVILNPIVPKMFHTGIHEIPVLSMAVSSTPTPCKYSPIYRTEAVRFENSLTSPGFFPL